MDKDQAIDFVIRQYTIGYSKDEIAQQLSQQLKAPLEIVEKFVGQTVDQNFPSLPTPPLPQQDVSPAGVYTDMDDAGPESDRATAEENGFIDLDMPGVIATEPSSQDFYSYGSDDTSWNGAGDENSYSVQGGSFGSSAGLSEASLYDPTYNLSQSAPAQTTPEPPSPVHALENDPEVQKFVIKELGKNSKQSDVIVKVCERYGIDWKDAQRLVVRIHSQNRGTIASRQNRLLIPMSVLISVAGAALLFSGIMELFDLRKVLAGGSETQIFDATNYFVRRTLPAAILGVGMMAGGLFGLTKALRAQAEARFS